MGFNTDPGGFPIFTVRDAEKWLPRLANGMIEIRGEGACLMPQQMARVVGTAPITEATAREKGFFVPPIYAGRRLILVHLELP